MSKKYQKDKYYILVKDKIALASENPMHVLKCMYKKLEKKEQVTCKVSPTGLYRDANRVLSVDDLEDIVEEITQES